MSSIRTELLNILLGNTEGLWFFWALFWGDLILWALYRFNKSRLLIPGIIIAMILWQFIPLLPFTLPFQLATSAEAVGFTGFGLIISKWMLRMGGRRACVSLVIAVLSFCILAWMAFVSPSNIFIRLILAVLVAMAGSCMIMFLSILLPAFRWFTPIGRNTIVFYGLNGLSLAIARTLFFHIVPVNVVVPNVLSQLLSGFAIIAVACLFCGVAVVIINRFLPWSIGLPRKD